MIWLLTGGGVRQERERLETLVPTADTLHIPADKPTGRQDMMPTLTSILSGRQVTEKLYSELASAGIPIRPSEFLGIITGSVILSQLLASLLIKGIGGYLLVAGIFALLPFLVLKTMQQKRREAFDAQIVDALMMISSSLRSGFSFLRAIQMVSQELPPPISQEFQRIINEVNVGRSMEDALRAAVTRVKSYDFDLVVTAVLIQLQVGGNLADILDTIAGTIRERTRINGEVKALTAEGRISGVVLVMMPVAMAGILLVINPPYIKTLITEPIGPYLICTAVILQVIGGIIIKKMLVLDI